MPIKPKKPKLFPLYNKNGGVKKMVKNISSDTTNSLDNFLIIIDNILYWSKCRCQFQLEFSTKAGGISAFSAEGNGIFMETEGKEMLLREGWFNVFIMG